MPYRRTSYASTLEPPMHSNDLERRVTLAEATREHHASKIEDLEASHDKLQDQLTIHERAILAICGLLLIALQDKFPAVAEIIKGLAK